MSQRDPTNIAALQSEREAQKQEQERRRKQELDDLRELLSTRHGRRIMWRLLAEAGVYRTTFRTSAEMAFLEGKRALGLTFLHDIQEACPERYVEMLKERGA